MEIVHVTHICIISLLALAMACLTLATTCRLSNIGRETISTPHSPAAPEEGYRGSGYPGPPMAPPFPYRFYSVVPAASSSGHLTILCETTLREGFYDLPALSLSTLFSVRSRLIVDLRCEDTRSPWGLH